MSNLFSDIFLQRPWRLGFVGVFVVLSAVFALWLSGSALAALGAIADFALPVAFFAALMALFHARSLAASRARVLAGAFAFAFWYAAFHVFLTVCAAVFV